MEIQVNTFKNSKQLRETYFSYENSKFYRKMSIPIGKLPFSTEILIFSTEAS